MSTAINKERSRQLHALTKSMRQTFLNNYIDKTHFVLWETRNEDHAWTGYTDNFIRVELKSDDTSNMENQISKIKITDIAANANHCFVELV